MLEDQLKLIVMPNCESFGQLVEKRIQEIRNNDNKYIVNIELPRFNNSEGKAVIKGSIRGKDVFVLTDIANYSLQYKAYGQLFNTSYDDHFMDIMRIISATGSDADKLRLVMPLLYGSRQHRRKGRESLDCAFALRMLEPFVSNILTYDVHDPNIQNALIHSSFDNIYPTHTILDQFIDNEDIDFNNLLVVSPDAGAIDRARFHADMLGVDVGIYHKRRDYSKIVDGQNKVVAHEYLGVNPDGKNIIITDDMIASGDSVIEVAEEMKKRGANHIYIITTFALFSKGDASIDLFNKKYHEGYFDKIYTTNVSYIPPKAANKEWIKIVDCSYQLAHIINAIDLNHSIGKFLNGKEKTLAKVREKKNSNN